MKILIAGASGRVGTALTNDLINNGDQVLAGARHTDHLVKNDAVTPVKLDLHASVDELAS